MAAFAALGQTPASAQIAWTPCGDTNQFACGHLTVPLDPSGGGSATGAGAGGETISLALRRHLAPVGGARDAVIALAGGPGQAAIPLAERFNRLLGPITATRDLIVFDQRGIGLSHPLSCAAFEHLPGRSATPRAIGICAGQLGPGRGFYTTADTVADIEAIRRAGGYEKLVLYGTSYGTKVAERYAQAHPDHVEALVLDSVVPPNGPDPLRRDTFAAIPRVLRALCAARACAGVTRDPVADLYRLVRMVDSRPAHGAAVDPNGQSHTVSVSSEDLLGILAAGDFNPFLRAEFPAAARSAVRGDTAPLARMLMRAQEESEQEPEDVAEGFDSPLFFATTCEEQLFPWNRASSPGQRIREAIAYARSQPPSAFGPFTAADALADGVLACAWWPFASAAPEFDPAPLPAVPTLIFSGADDIRTPTSGAQALAASIPGAQLVVVPHTGHSVLSSALGECPERALQAFFAGHPVKQCAGRDEPPYPPTAPLAPARLAHVAPAAGTRGTAGRALRAVVLTLADFERQSTFEFFSRISSRAAALGLLETRLGGLRSGWAAIAHGRIALHRYCYVPGVVVSGTLGARGGRLHVGGAAGQHGTLTFGVHGRLHGVLSGRRVSTAAPGLVP